MTTKTLSQTNTTEEESLILSTEDPQQHSSQIELRGLIEDLQLQSLCQSIGEIVTKRFMPEPISILERVSTY